MSDRFVTIATYACTPEAQLAKNLLETEGIPAFVAGDLANDLLSSAAGEARLQVHEQDAQRAAGLLAAVAAEVSLDNDWETQAEQGVWTCPLCGTAAPLGSKVCPACGTVDTGITTSPRDVRADVGRSQQGTDQLKKADSVPEDKPRSLLSPAEQGDETSAPQGKAGCGVLLLALLGLGVLWLV